MNLDKAATFNAELRSIGDGEFQLFIQNISSEAHFIRIMMGYSESTGKKRTARVLNSWIISPMTHMTSIFVEQFNSSQMSGRRVWIVFEAVERQSKSRKGLIIGHFAGLSSTPSKWLTTIGATTSLDIREIDISLYKQLRSAEAIESGEIEKLDVQN